MMRLAGWLLAALLVASTQAKVVINEISYHPPEDDDALEFIELHNSGNSAVDLSGWKFTKGIKFEFQKGTSLAPGGYLVLARDAKAFKSIYGFEPAFVFKSSLKNTGENIELSDAQGKRVDKVNYKDDPPWPLSADGESATLERISPEADGNDPANWAASALAPAAGKPAGTPGKKNENFAAALPPAIRNITFAPRQPKPGENVTVTAEVRDALGLENVELVYRVAGSGFEKPEQRIRMKSGGENRFTASIPGLEENSIVRFRIEALNTSESRRVQPGPNEPVPAISYFVHEKFSPAKIHSAYLVHVNPTEFKQAQKQSPQRGGPGGPGMSQEDQERFTARRIFDMNSEFSPVWADLCLTQKLSHAQLIKAQPALRAQLELRAKGLETLESADEPMLRMRELLGQFYAELSKALSPELTPDQKESLGRTLAARTNATQNVLMWTPEKILQRLCNVEGAFLYTTARADLSEESYEKLKAISSGALEDRTKVLAAVMEVMQGKGDQQGVEARMENINKTMDEKVGEFFADEAARGGLAAWRENNHPFRMRPTTSSNKEGELSRGKSAFVFVPAEGGDAEFFDFVDANARSGGQKVHLPKRHAFRDMSAINLIFEYNDRFVLAEYLAYEVYRKAGNAAAKTDFVRLYVDGRPFGYHLMVEQPNRAFLKRNKIRDDGNLYKILWYERGPVKQHEKKTNTKTGHDDLIALLDELKKTSGEEQWAVIKKNFNVEQVINYFAVNMVLSHWDGYFNNYFTYHDVDGSGKWEMYPWDQDKTWGFHDASGDRVFFDMPLTYGMEGDRPPGYPADRPPPEGFNGGTWWRPGGYFSKPLLANPHFRKLFLARTMEILENVYTEKNFNPLIDDLQERLKDEVPVRAKLLNESPEEAKDQFERNLGSLKEHLVKRRDFLLAQEELKTAGKFDRSDLR